MRVEVQARTPLKALHASAPGGSYQSFVAQSDAPPFELGAARTGRICGPPSLRQCDHCSMFHVRNHLPLVVRTRMARARCVCTINDAERIHPRQDGGAAPFGLAPDRRTCLTLWIALESLFSACGPACSTTEDRAVRGSDGIAPRSVNTFAVAGCRPGWIDQIRRAAMPADGLDP